MKKIAILFAVIICASTSFSQQNIRCLIRTTVGDIKVELYPAKVPITVANFLRYTDAHLYDGTNFFRSVRMDNQPKDSVKIEVIQGGDVASGLSLPPIVHESTQQTGIRHLNGTISMARLQPGTASCNFFICINDQPALDYGGRRNPDGQGFAAFGKVIEGMEIVLKIHSQPTDGQLLLPPVAILSISRIP